MSAFAAIAVRGTVFPAFLVALTLSLAGGQALAADCKGGICVGKWVIDTSDNIGQVLGFPEAATARYKVNGYAYESRLDELSPEVDQLGGISAGIAVVDREDNVGVAKRVFANGKVSYLVSSYLYVGTGLEPEVGSIGALSKGAVVIDREGNVGKVKQLFRNKKVFYVINSYTYSALADTLSIQVPEFEGLKADMTVIDRDNNIGKVSKLFADGRIFYVISGYSYLARRADLQPEVRAYGNLRSGLTVIDRDNNIGTVGQLFADGRVSYVVQGYRYLTKADSLTLKTDSVDGLAEGMTVIDPDNNIGKVRTTFADGRIVYVVNGYAYMGLSRTLIPQKDEVNGFRAGMVVIDRDDTVGTISMVFADGRAVYAVQGYSYIGKEFSKEAGSHPTYQKGETYATGSYAVGKAIRFFENGKVQLELVSGGTVAGGELFAAVEEVHGYRPELVITDSQGRDGVIKMAFANGAVAYQLRKPADNDKKERLSSAKVYGFFLEQDPAKLAELRKGDEKAWLLEVARMVATKENLPTWSLPWRAGHDLVIVPDNLPELKKALLERLSAEPALIQDKDLRKKVREHLSR